ncbi:Malate Na(+) symporter [Enterobacter hormaechei]|nr:Malate Na(+) symporter [Enterobacter hormaechei]
MSTTDDSFSVTHDPIDIQRPSLKERWWHIMDTWKIGIIPLPLFVLAGALIAIDCLGGKLPSDIVVMVATLAFFGFACGEFGKRLPIVGKLGAAAICATFIPSALVYYGLLPDVVVESTTKFYKSTNILYLYICCIIVGSIMSMNRTVLIQGFLRIFFPMLCGEIVGMIVGMGVGLALGLERSRSSSLSFCRSWRAASGKGQSRFPSAMPPCCIWIRAWRSAAYCRW